MILTAKLLDIANRGVLLNRADARNLGVLNGDRIQILNEANGISAAAFVDTTTSLIPEGTIGIYRICNERLCLLDGIRVEVREAVRPVSLD